MGSVGPSEVVERLLAAWDARDFDAFGNCLAEDVEWYDPAMGDPPARGRAAVRAFAEAVTSAFPDFRYEVLGPMCIAADGSRCAIRWRISGSHLRELKPIGYAPTGRRTSFEGVDVLDL
jgi:predicted ester cyclase